MAKYIGVVTGRRILLSNADNAPVELVQNDKDTTVIDFELSKIDYVADLSQLNVAINYVNIDKDTGESVTDIYTVDKTTVEGDSLKFSWTVGSNASVYAGKCIFQLVLTLTDTNDVITQQWDSTKQSIEVHASLENVNITQPKSFVDLVTQVKKSVSDEVASGITDDRIKQIVEQHFEENPVQVITDNTLSVSGTPADALATGTAIDSLKDDLNDLESDLSSVIDFGNPLKINRLDDGVFSFNEQDGYYIQSPINTQRVSCDTSDMGIIVGDVIGLEDYSTYQFAIGENDRNFGWIGSGYNTSDVTITEENIIHAKGILFKRNDDAEMTSQDKENIINLFGSKTRDNPIKIKGNKPLRNYVHISFDDIVRCFEDLATNKDTYNSIFDSEFFGGLKNLHDKYGAKFSLYCYDISSSVSTIGNKFADDFNNASDWLKFGFHLYSQGKNLAGYNAFLNDIFTLGMTFNSIDRLPRLDGFGGSVSDILDMRDADCGIIGLLTTDDSRSSYYLNDEQNAYLRTHSKLYDYENGLVMYSTNMRLDWFINGFSSDYEYNVPHESNPYDELTYRMKDRTFCNIYEPIVVFIHEWQVFTTSFTINSYFNLIEQVCKFANDYKLDFDYPYIRENFGITKSSLSVASTNGVHTKTELSFDWVMGAIDGAGGLVDSSTRIRTPIFKATKLFVEIPSGYKCNIGKYTSEDAKNETLENLTGWVTANQSLSDGYFVIVFSQTDDTASVEIGDLLKVVVIN